MTIIREIKLKEKCYILRIQKKIKSTNTCMVLQIHNGARVTIILPNKRVFAFESCPKHEIIASDDEAK